MGGEIVPTVRRDEPMGWIRENSFALRKNDEVDSLDHHLFHCRFDLGYVSLGMNALACNATYRGRRNVNSVQ
jgi:hypothetical protein